MAYNLESFELFVVSIPRTRRVVGYTVGAGVLVGVLTYAALVIGSFDVEPATALVLAGTFTGSALLAGEAIQLLVGSYPRSWGQYLALVILLVSAIFVPAAFLVGGSVRAVWFALGVAFLLCFQILVVSDGLSRFPLLGVASAVQPAAMAVGLAAAVPNLSQDIATHAPSVAIVLAVGLGLGVVALFIEWLLDANVEAVGGLEITSKLVQREHLHLGMGFPMEPTVQTLAVETGEERTVVAAPWVHPGIVEGIGGGRLSRNLLERLNDESQNGFFFHVPCTHRSDSADPTVHEPVGEAVSDPETDQQASQLLVRSVDGATFSGRQYGDSRVVFVNSQEYNDIELGIFQDVVDPKTTLVADQHAHLDEEDLEDDLEDDSPVADRLREQFVDFLANLDDAPLAPYRAGHTVDHDRDDISLFALVEEVDGQRTLVLGADRNEAPRALTEVRNEFAGDYDETLLFTTDSHASVYANRFDPQAGPDRIRTVITDAADNIADAAAGVGAERADTVDIMREDYTRLITSLNILARVFIVLLAGLHVVLLAGLLLL